MIFGTFIKENSRFSGIVKGEKVFATRYIDVRDLIKAGENADLSPIAEYDRAELELLSPIPNPDRDIICLGINYAAHAVESARFENKAFGGERPCPIYFSKRVDTAVPHNGVVDGHFDIVDSLDYEAELAVVIGKAARNVKPENAFGHVFGYTILNDISARNLQTAHKQWYLGKSLDSFTPIGPYIVTSDEFKNPPVLAVRSYVNGELRQNSSTDKLIFDIPYIIADLSRGMTLQPGTIISTGTPDGVGMGFVPPKFLNKGDEVICEIEGIGKLRNIIG